MSRKTSPAIFQRAQEILREQKIVCDLGGCRYHSGHEFCAVVAAWEDAVEQAADEALETQTNP